MADSHATGGPALRSLSCIEGRHVECAHLAIRIRGPAAGRRGDRLAFVCSCGCHSACALAGRLRSSQAAWEHECACPGARPPGRWPDDGTGQSPGFAEFLRTSRGQRRDRAAARAEALAAARAAAVGKTREEIRESYAAELRSRGLMVPPGPMLNAYADAIAGNRPPAGLAIRILAEVGMDIGELRKLLRNVHVFREDG